MGYGMRLRDASGNITLDTSEGVWTVLGFKSFNITWSSPSGSFTDVNLSKGTPFCFVVDIPTDVTYGVGLVSTITFSGTTCNWEVFRSQYGFGAPDQGGTLSFFYGYF